MSDQIPSAEEQAPDIDAIFEQLRGQPIENQVPALVATIQALIGQMADIDARLGALDKEIHEQFFDPIHSHYQEQARGKGIESIKQKYGSRFDEIADPLKAFGIDDVYSFLYDKLEELRKAPDYSPDQEEPSIDMFHKGAMDRIGRIRGTPKAEDAAAEPEKPATAVEVAIEKKPADEPPKKSLREKKMSMMGGY